MFSSNKADYLVEDQAYIDDLLLGYVRSYYGT